MDWQLFLVGVLLLVALLYLGRQTLRSWRGQSAGCGNCKCGGTAKTVKDAGETLIPLDQIRLRRRS